LKKCTQRYWNLGIKIHLNAKFKIKIHLKAKFKIKIPRRGLEKKPKMLKLSVASNRGQIKIKIKSKIKIRNAFKIKIKIKIRRRRMCQP